MALNIIYTSPLIKISFPFSPEHQLHPTSCGIIPTEHFPWLSHKQKNLKLNSRSFSSTFKTIPLSVFPVSVNGNSILTFSDQRSWRHFDCCLSYKPHFQFNCVSLTFKVHPEFDHVSPPSLLPLWSKPPLSFTWTVLIASQLLALLPFSLSSPSVLSTDPD